MINKDFVVNMINKDFVVNMINKDFDTNIVKNNEIRIQLGTQDHSTIRFEWNLDPLFITKQEPWYIEDATNGDRNPFDKSLLNATRIILDKFE